MGATAHRPKKSSRGQYKRRKAARLRGEPMTHRGHEPAPWFTFRPPVRNDRDTEDPILRVERELSKFGERARYRDRFREAQRAEEAGEFSIALAA